MRPILLVLVLLPLYAHADSGRAEDAYQGARKSYSALKSDPARRKFRHHWRNVARKFEQVAHKHPKSARAPDALFSAAELLSELSRVSLLDEDLQGAVVDYQKLCDTYPRSRLADDAALALGKIYAERLGQPEAARKVLGRAMERNTKGDKISKIRTLHASLGSNRAPKSPAPSPAKPDPLAVALARAAEAQPRAKAATPKASERSRSEDQASRLAEAPEPRAEEPQSVEVSPAQPVAVAIQAEGKLAVRGPAAVDRDEDEVEVDEPRPARAKGLATNARDRLKAVRPHDGEITLAEQLGLKVRRVVIDAGHGGHDSGAIGPSGIQEKDVSLAIAKRLSEILTAQGLEVLLTRDEDTFLRLEDRAKMANEAKGDLFISVHCNSAANKKLRGVETYTLNTSSDRYSIRLAARENSSSAKGINDLQFILADLATKANTEESLRLATRVQKSLTGNLSTRYEGVKDLGTKEALFYVLLGAKMPAILVETSFLSNAEDEKRLASKEYQGEVAQAIADGVQDFLDNRQRLAKAD
ncbi:MAG TPA: N-acetylmuramoyl-L-alanine amidase [Longimicrobium sp.]|nr:N-acetylmuramoyl-L-alanine amidase [Longimicrobium sp.]